MIINTSKDKLGKSRDISAAEFFSNLQLEYLTYRLREAMYIYENDVKKHGDIAKMKKEKIKGMARRQAIQSIFDSKDRMDKYVYEKFSNKFGMPNMQYTPNNKKPATYWDRFYFFQSGTEVYHKGKLYSILVNHPESETVEIRDGRNILSVPYISIKRDFEDLF
jgi:hypothetical protein